MRYVESVSVIDASESDGTKIPSAQSHSTVELPNITVTLVDKTSSQFGVEHK
jgi:hypothetical protein